MKPTPPKRTIFLYLAGILLFAAPSSAQEGRVIRYAQGSLFIDLGGNEATPGQQLFLVARRPVTNTILLVGTIRVVSGSQRFVRAELIDLAPGVTEDDFAFAARRGLRTTTSLPTPGHSTPPARSPPDDQSGGSMVESDISPQAAIGSSEGRIQQIVDDVLIYIEGMKGAAPLWSKLTVAGKNEQASFEIIKELEDLLVARRTSAYVPDLKQSTRVLLTVLGQGHANRPRRIIQATRVDEGPVLDGRLDDSVWATASPVRGFVQREPDYWMPGTERTEARILYDEDNLYVGFDCAADPQHIVANIMRRDGELHGDDHVTVLLDTYNDRQNGFFFFVNPLGAQRDLLLSNQGRTSNEDWDANWQASAQRHESGWTAEIQIPFDQLRFKEGETTWGINLGRGMAAKNEEVQLVVGTQSSSGRARYWTSDIGELRGMEGIRPKRLLQVKPYVLPGASKNPLAADPTQQRTFESGADLRYGITSNVTLDLSYNTDFAQVEGDQEQVNLTQFSLFFPEKREFFLEGANLFDFGEAAQTRGSDTRPPTLLFYSRRIGLEDRKQVPIILGSKVGGKVGRTSVGVLNVLTDDAAFQDEDGLLSIPTSNFSVTRMKQDLLARSNVGFIFVNKQTNVPDAGWNDYNRAGGVDFSYSPSRSVNIQGFAARTWDSDALPGSAYWGRVDYLGSLTDARAIFLDVDDHFEPEVGFTNRRGDLKGFRRIEGRFRIEPRPRAWGINSVRFGTDARVFTNRQNDLKNARVRFETSVENTYSDDFDAELTWERDEVTDSFEPSDRRPDIVVPVGTYDFVSVKAGVRTSRARKIQGQVDLEWGDFYTGKKYTLSVESAFRPSGRFNIETQYETNWLRMPEGNVNVQMFSTRLIYSFSTNFFVKFFGQWNNEDQEASGNFLLNYRYRPGSDIFLVYDQAYGMTDGYEERNRALLLKVSYLLRL